MHPHSLIANVFTPKRVYTQFSLWIPTALVKVNFSRIVINCAKIRLHSEVNGCEFKKMEYNFCNVSGVKFAL